MGFKVGDTVLVESKISKIDPDNTCKVQIDNGNYHWVTIDSIHPYGSNEKNEGIAEGWELAKKIVLPKSDGGFDVDVLMKVFGTDDPCDILAMPVLEVAEKVRAFNEANNAIKVGDVVTWNDKRILVTHTYRELIDGICADGSSVTLFAKEVTKTDDHINIGSLFEEIGKKNGVPKE